MQPSMLPMLEMDKSIFWRIFVSTSKRKAKDLMLKDRKLRLTKQQSRISVSNSLLLEISSSMMHSEQLTEPTLQWSESITKFVWLDI
jgi:hypothetical protein